MPRDSAQETKVTLTVLCNSQASIVVGMVV